MKSPKNRYDRVYAYPTPEDGKNAGDNPKRYPNGIAITAAALFQHWPHIVGKSTKGRFGSKSEFNKQMKAKIEQIHEKLTDKYPSGNHNGLHKKDIGEDLHNVAIFKSAGLTYMQLRRFSELVDLPVGLLLMFTNLISKERRLEKQIRDEDDEIERGSRNQELLNLVRKIELFAENARQMIESSANSDQVFVRTFDASECKDGKGRTLPTKEGGEEAFLANLDALELLAKASKIGPQEND